MDDQTQFLVLMGACLVAGFFLSLTSKERKYETRKFTEEEMKPYLLPKENAQNMIQRK